MLAEGIGRHQLVIEVAEPRGEGHLIVNARPPVSTPPEAVMRSSNVLTVALESLPAGEFRVDGLVGTRGTVLFTAGGSAEFDLLRSERCILE